MRKLTFRLSISILLVVISIHSSSQTKINTQLFDDYFNQIENFNGNVLVAIDGKPIFMKSFGYANLELDFKNNIETIFRIGSITKQFTSTAIFILYERGDLKLSDKISSYIDSLPISWQDITIHQLLNHTSGLMHSFASEDFKNSISLKRTTDEVIRSFFDKPLVAQPGEKVNYSGLGYFILAKIIENISGITYEQFLKKEIFTKVGMERTGAYNPSHIYKNKANGYQMNGNKVKNADFIYLPILTGGGNLYSTLGDLLKWNQAFDSDLLISGSTKSIMLKPAYGDIACGIGNGIFKLQKNENINDSSLLDSVITYGHGGWVPGFSSRIDMFPEKKILIVKLSNGDYFAQMWDDSFTQLVLREVYKNE